MTQIETMIRVIDAWDSTTLTKNKDGRLWQMIEEMRQAIEEALAKQEQKYRRGDRLVCLETDEFCVIHISGIDRQWVKFPDSHIGVYTNEQIADMFELLAKEQEQGEPVALDMTLDEAAVEMLNAFSSPSPHLNDYSKLRLMLGEGHSGYGLYLSLAEYPEEGSELLVNTTPPYVPTERQRKPLTYEEIRKWWARDNDLEDCDMCKIDDFVKVVREIEAAHGIKEQK